MKDFKYSKKELQEILNKGLEHGADFVELFFENTIANSIQYVSGKVTSTNRSNIYGVAARLLKGPQVVYGYTNNFDEAANLVEKLSKSFSGERTKECLDLVEVEKEVITECKINPVEVPVEKKIAYLDRIYNAAKVVSNEIIQIISNASDKCQDVVICNTNGVYASDRRTNIRISTTCVASDGKDMQTGMSDVGQNCGYEYFEDIDFEKLGTDAAKSAVEMLHADYVKGGKMTVVINNGFGGVLLHEACVHSLEATSVAKGTSVFCNKLGEKIASDIVTAVDDGTLHNYWGSTNVDDEGHKTQRNVLIENGILKSYLVDYRNSFIMNHPVTGSGRRQSYKYAPTSRMTNTFFENGKSTFEEIIASTEYGLFAKSMGGGSVEPATGEFNFSVREAYMIENGKITKPVKGATLVGSGKDVLLNIDMIGNNLLTAHGMCGSASGSIPTDVGQPTIRVQNMTVGCKN